MNNDLPETVWHRLREQTGTVLGEDFWEELSVFMPILAPRVDVYHGDGTLTVVIELPGVASPEGLELRLKKNILTLQGKIPCDYPTNEEDIVQKERFFGDFKRVVTLPCEIAAESAKSRFGNGLLALTFQKLPEPVEAKVPVTWTDKGEKPDGADTVS